MIAKLNPHISVDVVVFGFDSETLKVLLIKREIPDTSERYKLPGNLIFDDEDLRTSAYRTLKELTGLENIYLQQFKVFDSPDRLSKKTDVNWLKETTNMKIDRVVSVAYYSLVKINRVKIKNVNAKWVNVEEINNLAFDHEQIINDGLRSLQFRLHTEPIAFELLPKKFTLNQLYKLYSILLGKELDNRNFRKKTKKLEYIVPLNEKEQNVSHKPAQYFKFDKLRYNKLKNQKLTI